jgi:hypothetical protein
VWITVAEGSILDRECKVLDVSDSGAKIVVAPLTEPVSRFSLTRFPKSKDATVCDVVWQHGRTMGVKFVR